MNGMMNVLRKRYKGGFWVENTIIFFAGIYGVGKSTLCQKISDKLKIPYYSAGDLISKVNGEIYGRNKVVTDKDKNQMILIDSVHNKLEQSSFILDGHFCILNAYQEIDILPNYVYQELHIKKIVLLEADVNQIVHNLKKRDNKFYSLVKIEQLLKSERAQATAIAKTLKVELIIHTMNFDDSDVENLCNKLKIK